MINTQEIPVVNPRLQTPRIVQELCTQSVRIYHYVYCKKIPTRLLQHFGCKTLGVTADCMYASRMNEGLLLWCSVMRLFCREHFRVNHNRSIAVVQCARVCVCASVPAACQRVCVTIPITTHCSIIYIIIWCCPREALNASKLACHIEEKENNLRKHFFFLSTKFTW